MTERPIDDFTHERQALDAAHAQNEAGRDTFVALAHTALFAASISFVGSVTPIAQAIWKPVLISGWFCDVVGLLALTLSFGAARRAIDARRAALNDPDPPSSKFPDILNGVALWSFPVSLLCLFLFVTANVVHADDRKAEPPNATASDTGHGRGNAPATGTDTHPKGSLPTPTSPNPRQRAKAVDRGSPGPARSGNTACAISAASERVISGS